jgi:apolipoprotein N-acyltransferase
MYGREFLVEASTASKVVAAGLTGALLVLALPKPDLYYLSWVALVPLLLALSPEDSRLKTFGIGYAAGLVFFSGSCYWIVKTMATYGGLPLGMSLAVFALFVSVFALHTALFAVLVQLQLARFGHWGLLLAAPTWVAVELIQTYAIFGGFPWMLVGYALAPYTGLLQVVTITGVYGLSFLLVAVGSLLALSLRTRNTGLVAVAAGIMLIANFVPAPQGGPPDEPLSVRIVQTNIDIEQSWESSAREQLMDALHSLTVRAPANPDLVIWPETPSPFYLGHDAEFRYRMGAIARALDAHFLLGYIDFDNEKPSNSVGVISPAGEQMSRYNKIHLVPFGEYIPLGSILFFAQSLTRNVGDFVPGSDFTLTSVGDHRIASTICYEDVFPGLMRQFTRRGAEAIVNVTNDGWFGATSAPYQHLRMSIVRAVENRRYIIRGANTGISAIIDPYGSVVSRTELGERTVLDGVAGYRSDLTFYVRFGDVFAYLAATLAVVALLMGCGTRPAGKRPGAKLKEESI